MAFQEASTPPSGNLLTTYLRMFLRMCGIVFLIALSFSFFFLAALLAADRWDNTREDGVIGIVGVEEFFLSAPRSE